MSRRGHAPWCSNQSRALDERRDGLGALVVVELDVGQSRVVVDDGVSEVIAPPSPGRHPVAAALGAVAGDGVPGPLKARIARGVHVQQIAGAGPLVAVGRLLRAALGP